MTDWPSVHEQVLEKFAKGWARPEVHAWDDMLTQDVELIQPLLARASAREQFHEETRRLLALAPDVTGEVLDWAGHEDVIFIDLRLTATVGRAPIAFRTFDKLRITPTAMVLRREASFDTVPVARRLLTRPSAWWPWFRSGVGPLISRRRILPR